MLRSLVLSATVLLLSACQTNDFNRDYDPNRDFAAYRSWQWLEPAVQYQPDEPRLKSDLTDQRVRDAVSTQLDQRGLRPAAGNAPADLKVRVWLITEERQQQFSTGMGGAWGSPWPGYWGGPYFMETRTYPYQVQTLQIDLLDGQDGKLVWRGASEGAFSPLGSNPQARNAAIQRSVQRALSHYPPQ